MARALRLLRKRCARRAEVDKYQQLVDGTLLYTDDKVTSQNFGDTFTAISDEAYRIREYVNM